MRVTHPGRSETFAEVLAQYHLSCGTLSAEHAQQRVVTDLHQSEPHRHAEHEGEGKVRNTVELEEQCRENPEQRERPQDETDNGR